MRTRLPRFLSALVCCALLLTSCSPGRSAPPGPSQSGTTGSASPTPPAPSSTPDDPRTYPPPDPSTLTFEGDPDQKSPTWDEDLDPDSKFGLHRSKGIDPILRPEVVILDDAQAGDIASVRITNSDDCLSDAQTHPNCQFELLVHEVPKGVVVGSVINAGITPATPNGLLVVVTGISGGRVTARQASLADALQQGEFWYETKFTADDLRAEPTVADGVKFVPVGSASRSLGGSERTPRPSRDGPTIHEVSLPGTLTVNKDVGGVHLSGNLDFGVGCGLAGGVGTADIVWMEAACKAEEETRLEVSSPTTKSANETRVTLALVPLAAIPIPVGPLVLVVTVDILVTADLNGQVFTGMHYSASQYASVYGGLRYSIRQGLDRDGSVSTSGSSQGASLNGDVSVWGTLRGEVRMALYGVLGFSAGGFGQVGLAGSPKSQPRWEVKANAGIQIGMFLGAFGWELRADIKYQLKQPFSVAKYQPAPPTLTFDGKDTTWTIGSLNAFPTAKAVNDLGEPLQVNWNDPVEGVTVKGNSPSINFTKTGVHNIRIWATDASGKTAERYWKVTVVWPKVSIKLTAKGPDLSPLNPLAAQSGSTVIVDATLTSEGTVTQPNCNLLSWTIDNGTVDATGCRAQVTLGSEGTASISAAYLQQGGPPTSSIVKLTVQPAPPTVQPQFVGIEATTADGYRLSPGEAPVGQVPLTLTITYSNRAQAKVTPTYEWTVTRPGKSPEPLPGPDGELDSSTRTFTPPGPYGYEATFTVVIRDANSGKQLDVRTLKQGWISLPK